MNDFIRISLIVIGIIGTPIFCIWFLIEVMPFIYDGAIYLSKLFLKLKGNNRESEAAVCPFCGSNRKHIADDIYQCSICDELFEQTDTERT